MFPLLLADVRLNSTASTIIIAVIIEVKRLSDYFFGMARLRSSGLPPHLRAIVSPGRKRSSLETAFAEQATRLGLPRWVEEHRFATLIGRKWRFDFAWPDRMLAVEIDGGAFSGGRHTRGAGFVEDCRKMNTATLMGWRVLRFTSGDLEDDFGTTISPAMRDTIKALAMFSPPA